jgi:WhiB family redox-sensing transcriptional regulator
MEVEGAHDCGRASTRLPAPSVWPMADELKWQAQASCRTADPNLFFTPEFDRGEARHQREKQARQICKHCPVITPCAGFALRTGELYGVWGGLSEDERRAALGVLERRTATRLRTANRNQARRFVTRG